MDGNSVLDESCDSLIVDRVRETRWFRPSESLTVLSRSEGYLVVFDELFSSLEAAFSSRAKDEDGVPGRVLLDEFEEFDVQSLCEGEIVAALVVTVDNPVARGRKLNASLDSGEDNEAHFWSGQGRNSSPNSKTFAGSPSDEVPTTTNASATDSESGQ